MILARTLALSLALTAGAAASAQPGAAPVLASPPVLKQLIAPVVPPDTAFPGAEVVVVLAIDVSRTGAVEAVRIERGAGEPFDGAALAAARRFEFEPARLASGEAVPVTVSFQLRITPPPPPEPPPPPPVTVEGRLLERGTRIPLVGVEVVARERDEVLTRATTGVDGRFRLEVPVSRFRVVAVSPSHDRVDVEVEGTPGERREQTFYAEAIPSSYTSVVRGERLQSEITKQVLPAQEVAIIAGTQGDTLKATLNLPGAARPSFLGGALILRGSSPQDSSAFVEGLEIPILYHFGGLRSAFAPRFLDSVEFQPGNFPADYGRLTGGIINARVRDPATDLLRGEADFNVYDAGVSLEGPLSSSWSVGGAFRRSWIDTILPLFISSSSSVSFTTAPRFYDYQFLATWKPDARDRVRFLFFGSQDKLVAILNRPAQDPSITGDLFARIAFHELQTSWSRSFSPSLRQESWVALGLQDLDFNVGAGTFFRLATRRVDARSTWSWKASERLELRTGLDLQYARYQVDLDAPQVRKEGELPTPPSTRARVSASRAGDLTSPAAFAELTLRPHEALSIVPALRVDWDSAIARWSADPRLFVRWRVVPGTTLKGGLGLYQQPPSPDESSPDTGSPNLLPKRSVQVSAGIEQALLPGLDLDLTAFGKRLTRVVVRNPASLLDADAERYSNEGTGRIYGIEALLRARFGERFFGWIAYTFQRSLRTDRPGAAERPFDFDQPHILTALGTWRPNSRWAFGARFRLVSGNPSTPATGSIYDAAADVYLPLYGGVNSERQGTFHALDLRVDRTWTFQRWRLSAYLDVQNVYNRANQEGWQYSFDYRQRTPLTGLPILPVFGVKGEW